MCQVLYQNVQQHPGRKRGGGGGRKNKQTNKQTKNDKTTSVVKRLNAEMSYICISSSGVLHVPANNSLQLCFSRSVTRLSAADRINVWLEKEQQVQYPIFPDHSIRWRLVVSFIFTDEHVSRVFLGVKGTVTDSSVRVKHSIVQNDLGPQHFLRRLTLKARIRL